MQSTMETYVHMYSAVLEWAQAMEGSYLYNEGEGTIEGMLLIIHVKVYLDLEISFDIPCILWLFC